MNLGLLLIRAIHLAFILFMVLTPFFGNEHHLTVHALVSISLFLHWLTNNDTCALSVTESLITGENTNETFIGKIVGPVYNVNSKQIWLITVLLFTITMFRLKYQYNFGMIREIYSNSKNLFKLGSSK